MNFINRTIYPAVSLHHKVLYPQDTLTFIIKGTFRLVHDQPAQRLAAGELLPLSGDIHIEDDPEAACRYASDFVPFKPKADLLLTGHCTVPGGQPVASTRVSWQVGPFSKSMLVFGHRKWKRTLMGSWATTEAEPFTRMSLGYHNSYGGRGYAANPAGKGHDRKSTDQVPGHGGNVPNLRLLRDEKMLPMASDPPAGFGPLGATWAQRAKSAGTYKKKYMAERWPWLPEDFDWGYFNAAPADQQVDGYLHGDEALTFTHMHPQIPVFRSALPGIRVRCFMAANRDDTHSPLFSEIPLRLDTLWVDMDDLLLVLVWRGVTRVPSPEAENIQDILIVEEDVASPPRPAAVYQAQFAESQQAEARHPEAAQNAAEADAAVAGTASTPTPTSEDDAIAQARGHAHHALDRSGLDPALVAELKQETDPAGYLETLARGLRTDPAEVEKMLVDQHERTKALLTDQGHDASVLDDLFSPLAGALGISSEAGTDRAPTESRTDATAAMDDAQGEERHDGARKKVHCPPETDFRGAQLEGADLSGCDLSGADFSQAVLVNADLSNADLTDAVFTAADLSGASLERASMAHADLSDARLNAARLTAANLTAAAMPAADLSQADLSHAVLRRAVCTDADFTGATLTQADLSQADLSYALLVSCDLRKATLEEARAPNASFHQSDLSEAVLSRGIFPEADFTAARLSQTLFRSADLSRAVLEEAAGEKADFYRAKLEGLRAGAGLHLPSSSFRRAFGLRVNFSGANLAEGVFILSDLLDADFSGADLSGADCRAADFRKADLSSADLRRARFSRANLFQARMEGADCSGADFEGGNLYGAEFLDAAIDGANFKEANLTATKLDKKAA